MLNEWNEWNSKKYNNYCTIKNLSNFWGSFEMPLINCNIELKLKWTKYCVLFVDGADNNDVNSENIIFTIKHPKTCSCCNFITDRQSKTIKAS